MNIVITGATGFVGGFVARSLEEKGHNILKLGRRSHDDVEIWDITKGIYSSDKEWDIVIHCAALVDDWSSYADLFDVNVIGTKNVINSFPEAKNIIYISTGSVYSPSCAHEKVKENQCVGEKNISDYGKTKLLGENEIAKSDIFSRVVLRPHIIYGAKNNIVTKRIKDSIKDNVFLMPGNGKNYVCFTHIENLVHAIEQVIKKQPKGFNIYNIVDKKNNTIESVLISVRNLNKLNFRIKKIPKLVALTIGCFLEYI